MCVCLLKGGYKNKEKLRLMSRKEKNNQHIYFRSASMYWVSFLNSDTDHSSVINSDHWFAFRFRIIRKTVHVCRHRAICLNFQRYDKCSSTIFYKDVAWVRIVLWSPLSQRSFSQQILTLLKGAVCEITWIQVKSYIAWVKSLNRCVTVSSFVTWVGLHRAVLSSDPVDHLGALQ